VIPLLVQAELATALVTAVDEDDRPEHWRAAILVRLLACLGAAGLVDGLDCATVDLLLHGLQAANARLQAACWTWLNAAVAGENGAAWYVQGA